MAGPVYAFRLPFSLELPIDARKVLGLAVTRPQTSAELGAPIAQGRTAALYAWGPGQVLKLFFPPFAGNARREAEQARLVHASGVRAPAVLEYVTIEERPGIVYEQIVGVSLLKQWLARPWRWGRTGKALAHLHAQMHTRRAPELPAQRPRLQARIAAAAGLTPALSSTALATLAALPDGAALCHGDFHPDNVLATKHDLVIIDWIDATHGNPLADVARTLILLRFGIYHQPPSRRPLAWILITLLERAYLGRYAQLRPYDPAELQRWLPVVMAARLAENVTEEAPYLLRALQRQWGDR
jgi:aminoglycoside phosphotransferase (APT) family kinase protein